MKTWTAYYLEDAGGGLYHCVTLTNDDDMNGTPDGRIAIVELHGPLKDLLDIFGHKSRVHEGREISVFVNGVKQQ